MYTACLAFRPADLLTLCCWRRYHLFAARFTLFKQVYTHSVTRGIDLMILGALASPCLCQCCCSRRLSLTLAVPRSDVLVAADPLMHMSDCIDEPGAYIRLTDTVLARIASSEDPRFAPVSLTPTLIATRLDAARKLLERIARRQLYRLVAEHIFSDPADAHCRKVGSLPARSFFCLSGVQRLTAGLLCEAQGDEVKATGEGFTAEDIAVDYTTIDCTSGNNDPVSRVRFFDKTCPESAVSVHRRDVSNVLPTRFEVRSERPTPVPHSPHQTHVLWRGPCRRHAFESTRRKFRRPLPNWSASVLGLSAFPGFTPSSHFV